MRSPPSVRTVLWAATSTLRFLTCASSAVGQASQTVAPAATGYSPSYIACPPASATPLIRSAGTAVQNNQTLSLQETEYITARREAIAPHWKDYLTSGTGKGTGYAIDALSNGSSDWPVFAMAHSGGGFRAAQYAAGVQDALDGRNTKSKVSGPLQLLSYQAGLSGGSWYLSSAFFNGYPQAKDLVTGGAPGWQLDRPLMAPGLLSLSKTEDFYDTIFADAMQRAAAGFNVSITDVWGRALAYHLLPGTTDSNFFDNETSSHGSGLLFSQIPSLPLWQSHSLPFPIITACNRPTSGQIASSDTTVIPLNTTVYEFNPFEWGSYDPYLATFSPTKLMGTYAEGGEAFVPAFVNRSVEARAAGNCVNAFDQASFVYGTSSSLFNAISNTAILFLNSSEVRIFDNIANSLSQQLSRDLVDVANYPNVFQGQSGPMGFDRRGDIGLQVVDGGLNGENIPLGPLLVPVRNVDVIIAADASADTGGDQLNGANWPNGTAMVATSERVRKVLTPGSAAFPEIPLDPNVWVTSGYNQRPTFFGCDDDPTKAVGRNLTPPLVVYLPNAPAAEEELGFFTNTSTYKLWAFFDEPEDFMKAASTNVQSGFVIKGEADAEWPTCLACALVERTRQKRSIARSPACQACFSRYCYSPSAPASALVLPMGKTHSTSSKALKIAIPVGVLGALLLGLLLGFCVCRRRRRGKAPTKAKPVVSGKGSREIRGGAWALKRLGAGGRAYEPVRGGQETEEEREHTLPTPPSNSGTIRSAGDSRV